jgi:hypothetical protein
VFPVVTAILKLIADLFVIVVSMLLCLLLLMLLLLLLVLFVVVVVVVVVAAALVFVVVCAAVALMLLKCSHHHYHHHHHLHLHNLKDGYNSMLKSLNFVLIILALYMNFPLKFQLKIKKKIVQNT